MNECRQGKRYKTPKYNQYEKKVLSILPEIQIPEWNLAIHFEVYFSSKRSDLDNIIKPLLDILQKKYWFDDCRVFQLSLNKYICGKWNECVFFIIDEEDTWESFDPFFEINAK